MIKKRTDVWVGFVCAVVSLLLAAGCSSGSVESSESSLGSKSEALCSTATLSASPSSPVTIGTSVTLTAGAGCASGETPEYAFYYTAFNPTLNYIRLSGTDSNAYTASNTAILNTTGLQAGNYVMSVFVRSAGSSAFQSQAWVNNFMVGPVCNWVTASATPASPQLQGTNVAINATAVCLSGATPEYKFYLRHPTDSSWTLAQDWGGSTFNWDTSTADSPSYQILVYARAHGNSSNFESTTQLNYTVNPLLTLATGGVAKMNIVIATGASQYTIDAANELQQYLNKITGGNFTISTGTAGTPGILVGNYQTDFPTLSLSSALPTDSTSPTYKEGYVVQIAPPNQLLLIGKTDIAVTHAVDGFLNELGCRWFFQGPDWEVVPTAPGGNLTYSGAAIVGRPYMWNRAMSGLAFSDPIDGNANNTVEQDRENWRRRNALAYPSSTSGSNNSENLVFTQVSLTSTAPGYLGMIPFTNSQSSNWFNPATDNQTDSSCPPVNHYGHLTPNPFTTIETGNSDVLAKFWTWQQQQVIPTGWPHEDATSVEPGDGVGEGPISASMCDGTNSDQMARLANYMVGQLAAQSDPTLNQRYVTMLGAYYHQAPPSVAMSSKVNVGVIPYDQQAMNGYLDTASLLDGWSAKGATLSVWHNLSFQVDLSNIGTHYSQSLDGSSPSYPSDSVALANDFAMYKNHHVTSVVLETQDNFGAYGLGYYLISKLMWDPSANVNALRQDFFASAFGGAATDMEHYYDLLDPKGQPILFTKDLMSQAYAYLAAATTDAQGDTKVIARLNDLKSYMHHNALWWQIYRAPHNSPTQIQLVKTLLQLDYHTRFAYLNAFYDDLYYVIPSAATQFGADTDWDITNPHTSWRSDNPPAQGPGCDAGTGTSPALANVMLQTPPAQEEVDRSFACDQAYFAGPTPTQLTWTTAPVAVTLPGPSQQLGILDGEKPLQVALYTTGTSTSVSLQVNVDQYAAANVPPPPATITLNGQTQPVDVALRGNTGWVTKTFSGLLAHTGYIATVNGYGSQTYVQNPNDTPMAQVLDKIHRYPAISDPANGLFFYVPKGTQTVQYTWNRVLLTYSNDQIASPIVPHHLWYCPDATHCGATYGTAVTYNGSTDITDYMVPITVPVPAGADGKLWYFTGLQASELWFYNVPPYVSESPTSMIEPAGLDNLPIR